MMKHPRHKAKTIRVTLGFLILSLWKRPRSRAESCQGSCEREAACRSDRGVYFITDKSADPARWPVLLIFLYILGCPVWKSQRWRGTGADGPRLQTSPVCRFLPSPEHLCVPAQRKWNRLRYCQRSPSGGRRSVCVRGGGVQNPNRGFPNVWLTC